MNGRAWVLPVLLVEALLLAVLELFFLPLRLDGTLLPKLGDVPFPVTIGVATVTTPLLVLAAARLSHRLLVASAPLLVWLGTLLVLGLSEPSMLLDDWRTLMLFGGGALTGAVAVGATQGRVHGDLESGDLEPSGAPGA